MPPRSKYRIKMRNPEPRLLLSDCPFCGGTPFLQNRQPGHTFGYRVICLGCRVRTEWGKLASISITAWNRRVK